MKEHQPTCPRAQFWDAGEDIACLCEPKTGKCPMCGRFVANAGPNSVYCPKCMDKMVTDFAAQERARLKTGRKASPSESHLLNKRGWDQDFQDWKSDIRQCGLDRIDEAASILILFMSKEEWIDLATKAFDKWREGLDDVSGSEGAEPSSEAGQLG